MQDERSFYEEHPPEEDFLVDVATELALLAVLKLFDSRGERRRIIQLNGRIWEVTARELARCPEGRTPDV